MSRLDDALTNVPRVNFLPDNLKGQADLDIPLSIGYGQTNSQPFNVKTILKWLDPQPGDNVLDVGSGSGWTTGLISYLVGKNGKVTAVERVPELVSFGKENCQKLKLKNVNFYKTNNKLGWAKNSPYDCILVSASAKKLPIELLNQLKKPGKLVIPINESIYVISKDKLGNIKRIENPGFMFVPLIGSFKS